jgi:adenylate cyclase class IV
LRNEKALAYAGLFSTQQRFHQIATNIEIKVETKDLKKLRALVEELSDVAGATITQEDTFFHAPRGRLKLRTISSERGELIYYEREDASGPKPSNYLVYATSDPNSLEATLSASLGVRGIVRKRRTLALSCRADADTPGRS